MKSALPILKLVLFFIFSLHFLNTNAQDINTQIQGALDSNNVYFNNYLNFKITIPKSWIIDKEMQQYLRERAKDLLKKNEVIKGETEAALKQSYFLITAFKYEVGSPVESNPSIMILAENLTHAPGVKKGSDYLFHVRKLLASKTNFDSISTNIDSIQISKHPFYYIKTFKKKATMDVQQQYLSTIRKRFALSFILTYSNKEELEELQAIINSFQAKDK